MKTPMLLRPFLFVVLSAFAVAQSASPPAKPVPLPRLHVIGASVSGGFCDGPMTGTTVIGETVTLQHVLKAWCDEHARATTHNTTEMTRMFLDPEVIGGKQIAAAKRAKPDAVIALDFLFWYACGPIGGDEAVVRKERLAVGLASLASLERAVLVGDLPDMRGAERRVLDPAWIPPPPLLAELNQQIATFAVAHPQIRVVPLAELVRTMKVGEVVLPLANGPVKPAPGALQQGDKLHANRLGMAVLGLHLQPALQSLFAKDHVLHEQRWTIEQFVTACGADGDLEAVKAAAKEPAKAGVGR
ncbi:MAG: hypothetical protein WAT39_11325 [Planctomycetota bacterium]